MRRKDPERPRDTVLQRLKRSGLRARKALGQHFLHDPRILAAIADAGDIQPEDVVLEVGTGPGTLTRELAARAGRVFTVELDEEMLEFAREELVDFANIRFIASDFLDGKGGIHPTVRAELGAVPRFKLVSNLPYSIATQVLLALFEEGLPLLRAVVTIQKELAARLAATSGTPDYSPATVLLAFFAKAERLRTIAPGAFWPPPAVASEVLRLERLPTPLGDRSVYPAVRGWVHRLLSHRRKQLGGLLRDALGDEAPAALTLLGLPAEARPDAIPPPGYVALASRYPAFAFDKNGKVA